MKKVGRVPYLPWILLLGVVLLGGQAPAGPSQETLPEHSRATRFGKDGAIMRLVPGGTFKHQGKAVAIPDLWVDAHEVTVEQFIRFCEEADGSELDRLCNGKPDVYSHPALVQREYAIKYATHYKKRLPTRVEFMWLLSQGGATGPYPWGDAVLPPSLFGNYFGDDESSAGESGKGEDGIPGYKDLHGGLAPACSYKPDRFGLFDVSGNAWEWCMEMGHEANPMRTSVINELEDLYDIAGGGFQSTLRELEWGRSFGASARAEVVGFRCVQAVEAK